MRKVLTSAGSLTGKLEAHCLMRRARDRRTVTAELTHEAREMIAALFPPPAHDIADAMMVRSVADLKQLDPFPRRLALGDDAVKQAREEGSHVDAVSLPPRHGRA